MCWWQCICQRPRDCVLYYNGCIKPNVKPFSFPMSVVLMEKHILPMWRTLHEMDDDFCSCFMPIVLKDILIYISVWFWPCKHTIPHTRSSYCLRQSRSCCTLPSLCAKKISLCRQDEKKRHENHFLEENLNLGLQTRSSGFVNKENYRGVRGRINLRFFFRKSICCLLLRLLTTLGGDGIWLEKSWNCKSHQWVVTDNMECRALSTAR